MTMILKKDFTSFNHRLFVVPVSARAISFKSSPSGELSYDTKKPVQSKSFLIKIDSNQTSLSIVGGGSAIKMKLFPANSWWQIFCFLFLDFYKS